MGVTPSVKKRFIVENVKNWKSLLDGFHKLMWNVFVNDLCKFTVVQRGKLSN